MMVSVVLMFKEAEMEEARNLGYELVGDFGSVLGRQFSQKAEIWKPVGFMNVENRGFVSYSQNQVLRSRIRLEKFLPQVVGIHLVAQKVQLQWILSSDHGFMMLGTILGWGGVSKIASSSHPEDVSGWLGNREVATIMDGVVVSEVLSS
ncbi:hypothetical protein C5167_036862 [Papaver somniferum]|uniref:Uncharacterized protein n=1 Tax=Papaver somniferum TaxID=3469 RepID=A0A4Y7I8V7_PAPSO|nr:hypothetical protein C5167_036862 [Papaver somniferum]